MTEYKEYKNLNIARRRAADDDDYEFESNGDFLTYNKRNFKITNLSFAIDEPVREPKYYRQVVEEFMNLTENDSVQIRINSVGGRLDGLISLMEAIRQTPADVLAVIAGDCHSAASILALNCPKVMVTPYASMMVHNASYGAVGKDSDVVAQVNHNTQFTRTLMSNTYRYFLTDRELEDVLNGKEIWLTAPEIQERLQRRVEMQQKEIDKAERAAKPKNSQRKSRSKAVEELSE